MRMTQKEVVDTRLFAENYRFSKSGFLTFLSEKDNGTDRAM